MIALIWSFVYIILQVEPHEQFFSAWHDLINQSVNQSLRRPFLGIGRQHYSSRHSGPDPISPTVSRCIQFIYTSNINGPNYINLMLIKILLLNFVIAFCFGDLWLILLLIHFTFCLASALWQNGATNGQCYCWPWQETASVSTVTSKSRRHKSYQ